MDKIIGSLSAHVLGQIATNETLRESTAGKLRGQLGALSRAGVSAMAFTLAGMTLMAAPNVAKADLIGTLVGGGAGVGIGSLFGQGNGKTAAMVGGGVVGAAAGNHYAENMRALDAEQAAQSQQQARQQQQKRPGPDAIGPQFPTNESFAPNSNNGLAKTLGTVGGAVVGGVVGHFFGGGTGKIATTVGGAAIGAIGGRTAADMATAPAQVGVGQVSYVQTAEYGKVAVSPAPWGSLSPFMAQIEGFSQPTRSLSSNPAAAQAMEASMQQIEQLKRELQGAASGVAGAREGQVLAVSGQDMQRGSAAEQSAERAYTEAEKLYVAIGVQSLKNKLDNFALQGYDLRGYKTRAMNALDVPVRPQTHLKGTGHYNPVIARMVLQLPAQDAGVAQAPAQQAYATAQVGQAPAPAAPAQVRGGVPGVDYNHLVKMVNGKIVEVGAPAPAAPAVAQGGAPTVSPADDAANNQLMPQDQLPQGVTSRLKSSRM